MSKGKNVKDLLNMKEVREMLDRINRPIAFRRALVDLTGSVKAALMLSLTIYWQERAEQEDGWWYKTAEDWEKETGLSTRAQKTARRKAGRYLSSRRKDVPARLYWRVNRQALITDLAGWVLKDPAPGGDRSVTADGYSTDPGHKR